MLQLRSMLRISVTLGAGSLCLNVEGRLLGEWVALLASELERARATGARVTVDLAGVVFANRHGLSLLVAQSAEGVELRNCAPWLRTCLEATS